MEVMKWLKPSIDMSRMVTARVCRPQRECWVKRNRGGDDKKNEAKLRKSMRRLTRPHSNAYRSPRKIRSMRNCTACQSSQDAEITAGYRDLESERVLCHEHRRSTRRRATVLEMKEGPSGSAIRSLIPSHRERLWSKAMVVSVAETSGQ